MRGWCNESVEGCDSLNRPPHPSPAKRRDPPSPARGEGGHLGDLVRSVFPCFLLFAATPALAQEGPSFDCARASTPTEKAICEDEQGGLAIKDRVLSRLYASLKDQGSHDAVLKRQSAWLEERDGCGGDADCISVAQMERLAELAEAAGDASVTGSYSYGTGEDTNFGSLWAAREADGSLTGGISTVSGPTYHLCNVEFEQADAVGNAWVWDGPQDAADGERKSCRILVRPEGAALRVDSTNCRYYCGARGYFDETYARAK